MKEFNYRLVFRIIGSLLLVESVFLLSSLIIAWIYGEQTVKIFLESAVIGGITGGSGVFFGRGASPKLGKREGSLIVTLTWILFSVIGMMPYLLNGSILSITDGFFETMSGFTTTGASIMNNIESHPYSILYWRSMTHWIGGLGIIVISMALLPIFGFSGMQIFSSEATGPTKDKIHPKISETAKRLLGIYIVLTISQILLLRFAGMNWFDAMCHSFSTIATGGFSTKQDSIGFYDSPLIEYITIFFMIFSGVNFSLYYFFVTQKFDKVFKNEELRTFLIVILISVVILSLSHLNFSTFITWKLVEESIRNSLFVVSSTISTTGFVTIDYNLWPSFTWGLIIILMIIGSSAGSTAGGIKIIRFLLILKFCYYEFKRFIHPNAIFPVRYNGHILREEVTARILAFALLYIMLIAVGTVMLGLTGLGFMESFSGMITCLSDVGPGLGSIGPDFTFSHISNTAKWILSFAMLVGRLEIFTVLLIFTPVFWKR